MINSNGPQLSQMHQVHSNDLKIRGDVEQRKSRIGDNCPSKKQTLLQHFFAVLFFCETCMIRLQLSIVKYLQRDGKYSG